MEELQIRQELKKGWVSKERLCDMLELPYPSGERKARAYIDDLNVRLLQENSCVLSTSARKGYHIPSPFVDEDMAIARGAVDELKSKAISIFERRKSIENFLHFAESEEFAEHHTKQLTLF